jgi:hypothetical protein
MKMQKSLVETMLTEFFFMLKVLIIYHEFVAENQTVNGKFHKEVIQRWLLEFISLGMSFRKVGPGIFCTTTHRCMFRALSPDFW